MVVLCFILILEPSSAGHRKIYLLHREKRELRTQNYTRKVESSHEGAPRARWIQPLSTILSILFMFCLIMAVVACNIWCLEGDEVSSHGDSILDIELASSGDPVS